MRLDSAASEERDLLELVEQALDQPAAEREAWLETNCGSGSEKLVRARRLLKRIGDTQPDSYAHLAEKGDWTQKSLGIPNYRILRKIGSGGMADVFEAERSDGEFVVRVAVKVIKRNQLSEQLLQQFAVERQTLANLKHPNIVSLLDGGTTANRLPYVVMELVDGLPLDRYLAHTQPSTSERLQLFDKICAAVEHAHSALVIHRDIKPRNILVSANGEPKLLDFGLAKVLESEDREHTVAGAFTPAYASPEQVRGGTLSAATDIYSLGAVLYYMLTENLVHDTSELSALDAVNLVCSGDIERPSENTTSKGLRSGITQDLDAITLKALALEPERRYPSVSSLRNDLANFAARLPVVAQLDSRLYRLQKFISRNRAGVVAGIVSFVALVGGLAVSIQQTRVANEQLERATIVRDLMGDILMSPASRWDVDLSAGPDARMSDVLELAGQHIETNLGDYPDVQIELLSRLSVALERLSKNDLAVQFSETAMQLVETIDSPELKLQALITHGKNLTRRGRSEVGLQMLLKAEQILIADGKGRSLPYLYLLNDIGNAQGMLDRHEEQVATMNRGIALFKEVVPDANHPALAGGVNNLASALLNLGRRDEARVALEEAKAIVDLPRNQDEVAHAYVYMYFSVLEMSDGNLEVAEKYNLNAIEELSRLLGDETKELSVAMSRQAIIYRLMRQQEDAELWLSRALAASKRANFRGSDQIAAEAMLANRRGDYQTTVLAVGKNRPFDANNFFNVLSMFEVGIAKGQLGDVEGGCQLIKQSMQTIINRYDGALLEYMRQNLQLSWFVREGAC